jgi:hypothetical protein
VLGYIYLKSFEDPLVSLRSSQQLEQLILKTFGVKDRKYAFLDARNGAEPFSSQQEDQLTLSQVVTQNDSKQNFKEIMIEFTQDCPERASDNLLQSSSPLFDQKSSPKSSSSGLREEMFLVNDCSHPNSNPIGFVSFKFDRSAPRDAKSLKASAVRRSVTRITNAPVYLHQLLEIVYKEQLVEEGTYLKWMLPDATFIDPETELERKTSVASLIQENEAGQLFFNIKTFEPKLWFQAESDPLF